MNNVTTRGDLDWTKVVRVPRGDVDLDLYSLAGGDVLFNNTNSVELVGKTAVFVECEEPVVFSNHFTRLKANRALIHPEFLAFWLQAQWHAGLFEVICNRWVGQAAVQREKLLALQIPVPDVREQERIATELRQELASVASARAAVEERLEAARALRQVGVRNAFGAGDATTWPSRALGELGLDTRNGLYKPDAFYGSGIRILKMFNIGRLDGSWHLERVDRVELDDHERGHFTLRAGDVLVNRVNSRELVGKCSVVDERVAGCVFESKNMRIRLDSGMNPEFFAAWLNSEFGRMQVSESLKQIVGMATINRGDLERMDVPCPPRAVQDRVATELSAYRRYLDLIETSIEGQRSAVASLVAALLRRVFGGDVMEAERLGVAR